MKHFMLIAMMLVPLVGGLPEQTAAQQPRPDPPKVAEYRSGGIGEADAKLIRDAARGYSLAFFFATPSGQYLAGVDLDVVDKAGRSVINARDLGPIVLMNLPGGAYEVIASHRGISQRKSVSVRRGAHREIHFRWGSPDVPSIATP